MIDCASSSTAVGGLDEYRDRRVSVRSRSLRSRRAGRKTLDRHLGGGRGKLGRARNEASFTSTRTATNTRVRPNTRRRNVVPAQRPRPRSTTRRSELVSRHPVIHSSCRLESSMQVFLLTALIFGLTMAAMAVGIIFSNRTLKGSCGGTGLDCTCSDEARRDCALAGDHGSD